MNARDARVIRQAIKDLRSGFFVETDVIGALEKLLPKKMAARPRFGTSTIKQDKAARRKAQNEETAELRAKVEKRAGDYCECGCGAPFVLSGAEMDHLLGGAGRRRQQQSEKTCWLLTRRCHRAKTNNDPSADFWWAKADAHCDRKGFPRLNRKAAVPRAKAGP